MKYMTNIAASVSNIVMLPEGVMETRALYWLTLTSVQVLHYTLIVYIPPEVHLLYLYI